MVWMPEQLSGNPKLTELLVKVLEYWRRQQGILTRRSYSRQITVTAIDLALCLVTSVHIVRHAPSRRQLAQRGLPMMLHEVVLVSSVSVGDATVAVSAVAAAALALACASALWTRLWTKRVWSAAAFVRRHKGACACSCDGYFLDWCWCLAGRQQNLRHGQRRLQARVVISLGAAAKTLGPLYGHPPAPWRRSQMPSV